jgi:hypothetical protein
VVRPLLYAPAVDKKEVLVESCIQQYPGGQCRAQLQVQFEPSETAIVIESTGASVGAAVVGALLGGLVSPALVGAGVPTSAQTG